jgi:hypothetical protein
MVRAVAEAWFERKELYPLKDEQVKILAACDGWADRRNDLAHGGVDDTPHEGNYFLYPPLYTKKRPSEEDSPAYRYNAAQIEEIAQAFGKLWGEMSAVHTYRR